MDAKKALLGKADALKLAAQVKEIYVSKHKKVVHFDMAKDKPSAEKLAEAMLGPTGNMRAPAIRVGDILLIGFDEESYKKVLTK